MKNNKDKKNNGISHKEADFSGYTLEELRYQLAIISVKKEFLKEKALETSDAIKKELSSKMPLSKGNSKGVFSRIMKGLDLADYIMLGFQGFRIMKKFGAIFGRRK